LNIICFKDGQGFSAKGERMEFSLSEEQVMLRNMARQFATSSIEPTAADDDNNEHFPRQIIDEMVPLGLLGVVVPQKYGGSGVDWVAYAIITEEIARASLSLAMSVFGSHSVVTEMLMTWGSEQQRQEYLPPMCNGELFSGCALSESGTGTDVSQFGGRAELSQGQWVVNGEKTFVINGGVSGLVLAVTTANKNGEPGAGAFLVTRDVAGFSSQDVVAKNGLRACNIADIYFQDCRLPQENLLGSLEDGSQIAESLLQGIHLSVAAGCVGVAQACLDASIRYAQERQVFGRTIGKFDMIQEAIADMTIGTETARLLTYQVADLKDNGQPFTKQLAMARYLASDVAIRAATDAIHLHGAYGFGKDFPLERYFRDAAEVAEYGGSPLIHKLAIARQTLGIAPTA
jgi:alkylation response protein AidB-like acyl-CoA dehydrogenase